MRKKNGEFRYGVIQMIELYFEIDATGNINCVKLIDVIFFYYGHWKFIRRIFYFGPKVE